MSTSMDPVDAEWAQELVTGWVETYKKSATTLALLRVIRRDGPLPAAAIATQLQEMTGWGLTERGLYRTLRRLADSRVLDIERVDVDRTGMKRQDFSITATGEAFLAGIERAHSPLSAQPGT